MSSKIEFNYYTFSGPPSPVVLAEWRSPESPNSPDPKRLRALIDTGAPFCVIPERLKDSLKLCKIDEIPIQDYNDRIIEDNAPVYSVHMTIPPLQPVIAQVITRESNEYAIIGRDVINQWVLMLDGPGLKVILHSI